MQTVQKLFVTGERFSGRRAVEMGFAHRAVPAAQLVAAVDEEIAMIRQGGPIAVGECKRLVRQASTWSTGEGFEQAQPWARLAPGWPRADER